MANVHEIKVVAEVPFDWAGGLAPDEAEMLASWFLAPSVGVRMKFSPQPVRFEPVPETNGTCAIYRLEISGREAMSYRAQARLVEILQRHGRVLEAKARDVENNTGYEVIVTEGR